MSALFAMCAPAAMADESAMPTTQAQAYNADWVPYLDPPEKPAAVCLVDSGVNITPDTPADSPTGPIVKRLALDGGSGEAASPTWEGLHGTRMAFVGAAPVNGWGAVGFWPGARIVSIRAMPTGSTDFPFDDYSRALQLCSSYAIAENIAVVNLSLSCDCTPAPAERSRLANQVARAHANNESVVAAAGNNAGAVESPANEAGVLAVAAADSGKAICPFSAHDGPIAVVAPGCEIDLADPTSGQLWSHYQSGTSGASITTSVVLALLRSYRTDLDWQTAEQLLMNAESPGSGGRALDVFELFRSAGLGALADAARARMPSSPDATMNETRASTEARDTPADSVQDDASSAVADKNIWSRNRLRTPSIRALVRRGHFLIVSVRSLPRGARLSVALQSRRSEFRYATVAHSIDSATRITLRLPNHWRGGRLAVRFERTKHPQSISSTTFRAVSR